MELDILNKLNRNHRSLPHSAKTFGNSSTRNMIEHLVKNHGITKEHQGGPISQAASWIEERFRRISEYRNIQFNKKIFEQLLIREIIISNISFGQVEIPAFRVLLAYLYTCVCFPLSKY